MTESNAMVPVPRPSVSVGSRGLVLRSMDDMARFCSAAAKSGLAPKGMDSPEKIMIAVQMGAEVGLPPMASIQNIAVINGRPGLWGDGMLGVCLSSGHFDNAAFAESLTGTDKGMVATCTVRRLPDGQPVTRTFSGADAVKAGLWGKAGPWQQYPQRMLQLRARSFALRDAFADALRGIRAAEELVDIAADEGGYVPERTVSVVALPAETPKRLSLDDFGDDSVPPEQPKPVAHTEIAANVTAFDAIATQIPGVNTDAALGIVAGMIDGAAERGDITPAQAEELHKRLDKRRPE